MTDIIEKVLNGDFNSLSILSYDTIIEETKKFFPSINSEGTFEIGISGYCDGSREGGQTYLNFKIDKSLDNDIIADDQLDYIEYMESSDIINTITLYAKTRDGDEDPYVDTMFSVLYEDRNIEKCISDIQKIFTAYMNGKHIDNTILLKLSLIVSIASCSYSELKETCIRTFLDNLGG